LAPALLLGALEPRRLGPRLGAALLVVLLLPFLTRPPAVILNHHGDWVQHLAWSTRERWPGFRAGWTVWQGACCQAAGLPGIPPLKEPLDSPVYRALQLLTAALTLTWCLRRRGVSRRMRAALTLAMGMAWLMLFGPAAEHATYVF